MGIVYDDKAVDALLDRTQGQGEDRTDESLLANEYLSQFKVRSLISEYCEKLCTEIYMVHTLFLIDLRNFSPLKISSYMVFVFF